MSKMNRKQILGAITATTLLTTSGLAMANPQGLYSADELMDADVYLQNDDQQVVGEVEDVLLDDNMQVAALVVESDEVLGLDDQQYVVETG
ncbi:PRC-barrel domain-containing protein, partial [Cobetia marina]